MIPRALPWISRARPSPSPRGVSTCAPVASIRFWPRRTADRSRLQLNLDKMMPYAIHVDGNNIVITLGQTAGQPAVASAAPASTDGAAPTTVGAARGIDGIDFRRSVDGAGRVVVRLTDPHTPINLRQVGDQVVVDFVGTDLPKRLARRFDATDYGTSVTGFDATRSGNDARLIISAKGDYEQLAYQTNDQYVVEIQPKRKAEAAPEEKRQYGGEKMTLNFQDIDTRSVLQLLADTSGQNIVVSDSVRGGMTLRLQNVPWDQALDIVLRTKGLDKRQDGNVIIVAPADEIAAREKSRTRRAQGHAGAGAAALGVRAGQLRQGHGHGDPDQVQRPLAALAARQCVSGYPHQHLVAAGYRRPAGRHPPHGDDAGHSGAPGAHRIPPGHREQ